MASESTRIERYYPAGHRDRHRPHLCPECGAPLSADGRCDHCEAALPADRRTLAFPDARARLERMERTR